MVPIYWDRLVLLIDRHRQTYSFEFLSVETLRLYRGTAPVWCGACKVYREWGREIQRALSGDARGERYEFKKTLFGIDTRHNRSDSLSLHSSN